MFIGFAVGATAVGAMIGGFIGGTLSDLLGRKKLMIISLITSSLVYGGFTLNAYPYLLLFFTLIHGFSYSFFEPCAKALIADYTEPQKRLKAFSLRYLATNLGFAVGPLIGVLIGVTSTSTIPFMLASLTLLTYAIILLILFSVLNISEITERNIQKTSFKRSLIVIGQDRALLLFLCGGLLATCVHGQFSIILAQYFEHSFPEGLAYLMLLWSIHSTVIILFSLPITRLMEKMTSLRAIIYGTLLFSVGIIGFALSSHFWSFTLAMIIFTIGEIFLLPSEYRMIDEITPEHVRGAYYGAINFTNIGSFIGPGFAGLLLVHFGGMTMFGVLALISVFSITFYFLGHRLSLVNPEQKDTAL
jgi:MFS family permease